jgi:hypothetical protein
VAVVGWADEILAPVTSSLLTAGTEDGDVLVAIKFDGWAVVI